MAICEFEDGFFEDVADAFNGAGEDDIAIAFNPYHPRKGREVVHMNGRAFELHKKHPGESGPGNNSASYRSRTTYEEITPESVRDGLWIYQYGVAGREGFDGCYFRQTMLSEAALTPTIFVCRPINYKWLGELPTSYIEGEDLKTEVFMNAAYQGERDKIELMNKLLEQKALDPSRYHPRPARGSRTRGATRIFRLRLRRQGGVRSGARRSSQEVQGFHGGGEIVAHGNGSGARP